MTTDQQVTAELNNAYDKFQNEIYDGKTKVPENIINLFKNGIMALSPFSHKINFGKVNVVSKMKITELTNFLLSDIIKVILNTPIGKLYPDFDFENAIKEHIVLEKFILEYNKHIDEFRKKLEMRKATLDSLTKVSNNRSPLSIIN